MTTPTPTPEAMRAVASISKINTGFSSLNPELARRLFNADTIWASTAYLAAELIDAEHAELRKESERLRDALQRISESKEMRGPMGWDYTPDAIIARAALKQKGQS